MLSKAALQALAYCYASGSLPRKIHMATWSVAYDLVEMVPNTGRYVLKPRGLEAIAREPWKLGHDYLTAGGFQLDRGGRKPSPHWLEYRHEDGRTATLYRSGTVNVRPHIPAGAQPPFPLAATYADFSGKLPPVPLNWPVVPLAPGEAHRRGDAGEPIATCGACGRSWDDGKVTGMTPAPAARCPFEAFHA